MCSTKCSPGISLSNDLVLSEMLPIQPRESPRDLSLLDSNSEFEFCVTGSFEYESSSADELFFNGVIVPTQNQQRFVQVKQTHRRESAPFLPSSLPPLPPAVATENSKKENTGELVHDVNSESEKKSRSKSFWGFRRSNSVTYDSRKSSFCSLPLLSRSNSTGSVQNPKRTPLKDVKSQSPQLQRQHSVSECKPKSSFLTSPFSNSYSKLQRPQKKNQGGLYGNSLYVNPILNVPPPYISKETANIFGLSSLFRGSKEKKSRK